MTSSDTLPLSEDQQALQDTLRGFLAGPAAACHAAGRAGDPAPVTAPSCTPAWPVSSGWPG